MTQPFVTIIVSYFSQEEVVHFVTISKIISILGSLPPERCKFLLCSVSTGIEPSTTLREAFQQLAPVEEYRCQTIVEGYPARPSAMFWEIMKHISETQKIPGFSVWLEADMVPVKSDWIERLCFEWNEHKNPLIMGMYVPLKYGTGTIGIIPPHINGGACYANDFFTHFSPAVIAKPLFDVALYATTWRSGRTARSNAFVFSSLRTVVDDIANSSTVILHAFKQDRTRFFAQVHKCITQEKLAEIVAQDDQRCCQYQAQRFGALYCCIHSPYTLMHRIVDIFLIAKEVYRQMPYRLTGRVVPVR